MSAAVLCDPVFNSHTHTPSHLQTMSLASVPFSEAPILNFSFFGGPILNFGAADRQHQLRQYGQLRTNPHSSPKLKSRGVLTFARDQSIKGRTRSSRKPRPQVRCKRWERTSAAATAPVATAPFPSLRLKRHPQRCGWENCADFDSAGGHYAHCTLDDAHSVVSTGSLAQIG
jgi:hypothetical protein